MLNIDKIIEDGKAVFVLGGRLDTTTAPVLDAALKESLAGVSELTLDFSEVGYISSAGLRVLLTAQKLMNTQGRMKITHVNEIVKEIFDISGFSRILTIE